MRCKEQLTTVVCSPQPPQAISHLCKLCRLLPRHAAICYVAFNKCQCVVLPVNINVPGLRWAADAILAGGGGNL